MSRSRFHAILSALLFVPVVGMLPGCSGRDAAPAGGSAARPTAPAPAVCDSIAALFERHGFVRVAHPPDGEPAAGTCVMAFTLDGTDAGQAVREALTRRGWTDVLEKAADGPDGTHFVCRRDSIEVEVVGSWVGGVDGPPPTRSGWSVVVRSRTSLH